MIEKKITSTIKLVLFVLDLKRKKKNLAKYNWQKNHT